MTERKTRRIDSVVVLDPIGDCGKGVEGRHLCAAHGTWGNYSTEFGCYVDDQYWPKQAAQVQGAEG